MLSSARYTQNTVFFNVLELRSEIEFRKMSLLYRGQAFQGEEPFFLCVNKFLKVAVLLQKLFHFIKIVLDKKKKKSRNEDLPLFESKKKSI